MGDRQELPHKEQFVLATDEQFRAWDVQWEDSTAQGPCPVCGHSTVADLLKEALALGEDDAEAEDHELIREFSCACDQTHPEGKAEKRNCGARWAVRVLKPAHGEATVEPVAGDVPLAAARELAKQAGQREATIKASAEKWIGGIAALLALFGISGIAVGKDSLRLLDQPYRALGAIAVALGVLLAVIAIVNIYRAAFGWPTLVDVTTSERLKSWYNNQQNRLSVATQQFRRGISCAVGSLVALFLAAGLVALSPLEDPPSPKVKTTLTDETFVCGKLLDSSDDDRLRILKNSGDAQVVATSEVVRLDVVAACS